MLVHDGAMPTDNFEHALPEDLRRDIKQYLQRTGANKGAFDHLGRMMDAAEKARGVVAVSSGNHAQGVAWAARRLGIAATIVMPRNAPQVKLEATRALVDYYMGDRKAGFERAVKAVDAMPEGDDTWTAMALLDLERLEVKWSSG